jgi:prepilin-type N-terminal cleavage/methylation domain-containing protein/prepilin-type processing-associated H-X9-DG protein
MKRKAFTLVELLVVISIIAILLAVLMPALSAAREVAKSVICRTNMHNISMNYRLFANENNGALPPACSYKDVGGIQSHSYKWPMFLAPYINKSWKAQFAGKIAFNNYRIDWVQGGEIFYCPKIKRPNLPVQTWEVDKLNEQGKFCWSWNDGDMGQTSYSQNCQDASFFIKNPAGYWPGNLDITSQYKIDEIKPTTVILSEKNRLAFFGATSNSSDYKHLDWGIHRSKLINFLFIDGHLEQRRNHQISEMEVYPKGKSLAGR